MAAAATPPATCLFLPRNTFDGPQWRTMAQRGRYMFAKKTTLIGIRPPRNNVMCQAKKDGEKKGGISFGDQLLDYIEGGPKLRKWYGAPDQLPLRGEQSSPEEQQDEDEVGDALLVTDADSDTGQLVVLSAILQRLRVRALVKDTKAATAAFGPYVEPIAGDVSSVSAVDKALRGVRAIICTNQAGLLSGEGSNPFEGLLGGGGRKQCLRNEAAVASCGVPYTIVRAGKLRDEPGGGGVCFSQGDTARGSMSREDAAEVCVRALKAPPQKALVFEVVSGEGSTTNWEEALEGLQETIVTL